jgi:hypothetical protein
MIIDIDKIIKNSAFATHASRGREQKIFRETQTIVFGRCIYISKFGSDCKSSGFLTASPRFHAK